MIAAARPGQPQSCSAPPRPVARMPMFTTFCRRRPGKGNHRRRFGLHSALESKFGGFIDADQLRDLAGRLPHYCRLRRRRARRFLQLGRAEILRRRLSQILRRVRARERRLARMHGQGGQEPVQVLRQGADPVGRGLTSRSRPPQAQLAATSFLSYRRKPVSRTARSEIVVLDPGFLSWV